MYTHEQISRWNIWMLAVLGVAVLYAAATLGLASAGWASGKDRSQVAAAATTLSLGNMDIVARAAFVYDLRTGEILYAKNAHEQLPLASVTKLMLAVVVSETLKPDARVIITREALAREGDSGLTEGEEWQAQDLIDFTLVESSNDGAEALAYAAGHTAPMPGKTGTEATVARMNMKARSLGLSQTYFLDPSGLDESTTLASAYGSAADVALLMAYAIEHHLNAIEGTARNDVLLAPINGALREAYNTNDALDAIPGLIAGKTGFTDLAGGNLVIAFDAGVGRPVVVVVLGSTQEGRFEDMKTLIFAVRSALAHSGSR